MRTCRDWVATALFVVAILLLATAIYGMLQSPRPGWTRISPLTALVLILAAGRLRRRVGRGTEAEEPRTP